ncbi:MAG: hypothetical protein WC838_04540, partial [Candidatus Margulisiibacteriota bacterium]
MRRHKILFIVLLLSFSGAILSAAEQLEKPAFDVPDVVIKARDLSKSDWLQKSEPAEAEQIEILYQKEVPVSKKIEPDALISDDKISPQDPIRKERTAVNDLQFHFGNISLLSYQLMHGQTRQAHTYLLNLSRDYFNNYLPFTSGSRDKFSLDYTYKFNLQEKVSVTAGLEQYNADCPSGSAASKGMINSTYIPLKITYAKDFQTREHLSAVFSADDLGITAKDRALDLFSYSLGAVYDNQVNNTLVLSSQAGFGNKLSRLGASLSYLP